MFLSFNLFLDLYQAVRMEKEEKVEMLALWERRGWSKGWRFSLTCWVVLRPGAWGPQVPSLYPYNKVTVCLFSCLFIRISLTAQPIGFSFTGYLLIGPGKVYNYFGGGYYHPSKKSPLEKKITPPPKKKKKCCLPFLLNIK